MKSVLGAATAAILVACLGSVAACSSEEAKPEGVTAHTIQAASVSLTLHDANGTRVGEGSGILLSPRVVLTAAHLVAGKSRWTVTSADGKTRVNGVQGVTADWMVYNSDKAHPRKHDVAIIYLDHPIKLSTYPTVATNKLAGGSSVMRIHGTGGGFDQVLGQVERTKSSPNAYLMSMPGGETLDTGGAVVNERNEIVGLVTGRGKTTGKLYIARTDGVRDFISPKVACGNAAAGLGTRTYNTPPPKDGCEDNGNTGGNPNTNGSNTTPGGSNTTPGGSSTTPGGSNTNPGNTGGGFDVNGNPTPGGGFNKDGTPTTAGGTGGYNSSGTPTAGGGFSKGSDGSITKVPAGGTPGGGVGNGTYPGDINNPDNPVNFSNPSCTGGVGFPSFDVLNPSSGGAPGFHPEVGGGPSGSNPSGNPSGTIPAGGFPVGGGGGYSADGTPASGGGYNQSGVQTPAGGGGGAGGFDANGTPTAGGPFNKNGALVPAGGGGGGVAAGAGGFDAQGNPTAGGGYNRNGSLIPPGGEGGAGGFDSSGNQVPGGGYDRQGVITPPGGAGGYATNTGVDQNGNPVINGGPGGAGGTWGGTYTNGSQESCSGPTDNPEVCPPETDGCAGPSCGGGIPDDAIDYGGSSASSDNSGGEIKLK